MMVWCFILVANAQQVLKEGKVTYELKYGELPVEMQSTEAMLPTTIELKFKNNRFRTDMQMMQGLMTMIFDEEKKQMVMLMDMMGKKMKMTMTEAQMKKKQDETFAASNIKNIKVQKTSATKMIAGYSCNKYEITFEKNGKVESTYCYTTEKLPSSHMLNDNPIYASVKGFMMEYAAEQQGMVVTMIASAVKAEKVADDQFAVPTGYEEIDPALLQRK